MSPSRRVIAVRVKERPFHLNTAQKKSFSDFSNDARVAKHEKGSRIRVSERCSNLRIPGRSFLKPSSLLQIKLSQAPVSPTKCLCINYYEQNLYPVDSSYTRTTDFKCLRVSDRTIIAS